MITRAEMDDFGLHGIDDVMRVTPGISIVTYDSERTEYYARGFAVQNFQYDGIPMSRDSAYSAGNTLSDTAIYDRIEVLKGATGLLTGMGDPGATINLVRKKPGKDFAGSATLGVGRWDDYRAEIDVGGPLTADGRVRGRAVGAWQDKHSNLDYYQRTSKVGYAVLEADLGERTLLTVGGDAMDSDPKGSTWAAFRCWTVPATSTTCRARSTTAPAGVAGASMCAPALPRSSTASPTTGWPSCSSTTRSTATTRRWRCSRRQSRSGHRRRRVVVAGQVRW